jgi:hypothetical protein
VNDAVLVSSSFTPAVFRALMILFINSEFAANAAFALALVVSTPSDTVTLSGFVSVVAEPVTNNVLLSGVDD